jgi:hypothetical protein
VSKFTPEQIEEALAAITSRLTVLDTILKAAKAGRVMVMAFHCNHSGLYFPADYCKEWGKLYGIGLGSAVVSEVFDTDYNIPPPDIDPTIRRIEQIMHPVRIAGASVNLVTIGEEYYKTNLAICAKDDPFVERRAAIVRAKQLVNPHSTLRVLQAAWDSGAKK